eukprot:350426-Chlamydomonas_euryale.AAC.8
MPSCLALNPPLLSAFSYSQTPCQSSLLLLRHKRVKWDDRVARGQPRIHAGCSSCRLQEQGQQHVPAVTAAVRPHPAHLPPLSAPFEDRIGARFDCAGASHGATSVALRSQQQLRVSHSHTPKRSLQACTAWP